MTLPETHLQLLSSVSKDGQLEVKLAEKPLPELEAHQVLVRVEASPINPSDLGVLFGLSDVGEAASTGDGRERVLRAPIPPKGMRAMKARVEQSLPVGNEGAGTVVAAGESESAQALMGKVVAAMGGGMYAQYRKVDAAACLVLQEGHTPRDGASCFVNPLTALSMVETMRLEGHSALIHTAAASNLGQMLVRICRDESVGLVNVVRKAEQVKLLKELGAEHVVDSSQESFLGDLIEAIHATGATLAFDAIGGGSLASSILMAMEASESRRMKAYSIYGSTTHKQLYIYGSLDNAPTTLARSYGMAWGVGGWLLPNFMARAGREVGARMRARVAKELKTTFASHYTDEISLFDALDADTARRFQAKKTGQKFLLNPQLG
ncbi:MAG: zinc-binding dehydrogenase [Myxococcota bacterium]